MEFGLVHIDRIEPRYVQFFFPLAIIAGLVFARSIIGSLQSIRKKDRHSRRPSSLEYIFTASMLAALLALFLVTCHYFIFPAESMVREYANSHPGTYDILHEAKNRSFLDYVYFGVPSTLLGILAVLLLTVRAR